MAQIPPPIHPKSEFSLGTIIDSIRTASISVLTATRRWRMRQDIGCYVSSSGSNPETIKQLVEKIESMEPQHYQRFMRTVYTNFRRLGWVKPYPALVELYMQRGAEYLQEHPEAFGK